MARAKNRAEGSRIIRLTLPPDLAKQLQEDADKEYRELHAHILKILNEHGKKEYWTVSNSFYGHAPGVRSVPEAALRSDDVGIDDVPPRSRSMNASEVGPGETSAVRFKERESVAPV